MNSITKVTTICTVLFLPTLVMAKEKYPSADEIIAKLDKNMVFESRKTLASMRIKNKGRIKVKKMMIYSKGEDTSYSEFLSPARDKGVKYLKLKDNLWMYLPSAEKVVKISGHMLRQSMMGSDFSYEDMLDANALRTRYKSTVTGIEKQQGLPCYVIEMNQIKDGETYPKRKLWIDVKNYVTLRSELFAASGRLLKVTELSNIKKYGERLYPTKIRMYNKLQKGTWTELTMDDIQFKVALPDQIFSLRKLQRD